MTTTGQMFPRLGIVKEDSLHTFVIAVAIHRDPLLRAPISHLQSQFYIHLYNIWSSSVMSLVFVKQKILSSETHCVFIYSSNFDRKYFAGKATFTTQFFVGTSALNVPMNIITNVWSLIITQ